MDDESMCLSVSVANTGSLHHRPFNHKQNTYLYQDGTTKQFVVSRDKHSTPYHQPTFLQSSDGLYNANSSSIDRPGSATALLQRMIAAGPPTYNMAPLSPAMSNGTAAHQQHGSSTVMVAGDDSSVDGFLEDMMSSSHHHHNSSSYPSHSSTENVPSMPKQSRVYTPSGVQLFNHALEGKAYEVRNYVCDVCGKAFVKPAHLSRHKLIHEAPRNFKCSYCEKAFYRKDKYKEHVRTHLRKTCETCSTVFEKKSDLQRHLLETGHIAATNMEVHCGDDHPPSTSNQHQQQSQQQKSGSNNHLNRSMNNASQCNNGISVSYIPITVPSSSNSIDNHTVTTSTTVTTSRLGLANNEHPFLLLGSLPLQHDSVRKNNGALNSDNLQYIAGQRSLLNFDVPEQPSSSNRRFHSRKPQQILGGVGSEMYSSSSYYEDDDVSNENQSDRLSDDFEALGGGTEGAVEESTSEDDHTTTPSASYVNNSATVMHSPDSTTTNQLQPGVQTTNGSSNNYSIIPFFAKRSTKRRFCIPARRGSDSECDGGKVPCLGRCRALEQQIQEKTSELIRLRTELEEWRQQCQCSDASDPDGLDVEFAIECTQEELSPSNDVDDEYVTSLSL